MWTLRVLNRSLPYLAAFAVLSAVIFTRQPDRPAWMSDEPEVVPSICRTTACLLRSYHGTFSAVHLLNASDLEGVLSCAAKNPRWLDVKDVVAPFSTVGEFAQQLNGLTQKPLILIVREAAHLSKDVWSGLKEMLDFGAMRGTRLLHEGATAILLVAIQQPREELKKTIPVRTVMMLADSTPCRD